MIKVNDYVRWIGTQGPTGIVEALHEEVIATVRWGIDNGEAFKEDIAVDKLMVVDHENKDPQVIPELKPDVVHKNVFDDIFDSIAKLES